jgi:hypothetical protein
MLLINKILKYNHSNIDELNKDNLIVFHVELLSRKLVS